MGTFIYSNNIGCFVFDAKGNMTESRLYKTQEQVLEASEQLKQGTITTWEKEMAVKHSIPVLGLKSKGLKVDGISTIFDPVLYAKAGRYMIEHYRKELIENTILIAKHDVKESVKKDVLIIQSVNNIQENDKLINTLAKRLREWYSYYLPELSNAVTDNEKFAELVEKKGRYELLSELKLKDEMSMGKNLPQSDVAPMKALAGQILSLSDLRKSHEAYLDKVMKEVAPNVRVLAGSTIGAKLIAHAGSVERLSAFPASTVQVLGAEKALFRHMKTGSKPPKFGVIINHPIVANAGKDLKGKAARLLADKISIAAKIDYFKGDFIGDKLKRQVEDKLK